jgi:peptidoglycan hydrolase-like protein with peptidoglycan-binding domain
MELSNTTLRRGSRGDDVIALQEFLISQGFDIQADGVYGPLTQSAVSEFQSENGLSADGIFGPNTLAETEAILTEQDFTDTSRQMFDPQTGEVNNDFIPRTQEEANLVYNSSALSQPVFQGNTPEDIEYAATTGDFSRLRNEFGKPFSDEIQQQSVRDAEDALNPRFEIDKEFETQRTEDALRQNQQSFDNAQQDQADNFETDKATLDQNAANRGVLFSGARDQKERKLQNVYNTNQNRMQQTNMDNISSLSGNFQRQFGDKAANQNRLSQFFSSGSNTFNPKVATGGAQKSSLSQTYKPKKTGFIGTANTAQSSNVQRRSADLLANRANKLFSTGVNNQR